MGRRAAWPMRSAMLPKRPWRVLPAALLAAWLAGCTVPPPQPATEPAASVAGAPAAPQQRAAAPQPRRPASAVPQDQSAPALRIKPERVPGEGSGTPALRAPAVEPPVLLASGRASFYADSLHGRRTANGERYDREEFTAAHRSLPFGARLCVRSLVNGRTVIVRVNDRGPFTPGRIIDLSRAAAEDLGMMGLGVKSVELWRLGDEDEACPENLEQAAQGSGLGLDGGAADRALQRPAARKPVKAATARKAPRKRR